MSLVDPNLRRERCPDCFQQQALCLCAEVEPVDTRIGVTIVRHALERKKSSNTGRLAALVLKRCSMHTYGAAGRPFDERQAFADTAGSWLLFPEGSAAPDSSGALPRRLVVLDGNWNQARRMRQRIASLRGMPVLALPAAPPRKRLRTPPRPDGVSTIEAIAAALGMLGEDDAERALLRLYDVAVERFARAGRL